MVEELNDNIEEFGIAGTDSPPKTGLTLDKLEGMLQNVNTPSIAGDLVNPGDDLAKLMMRTTFKDERQKNAACQYLALCQEFENDDGIEALRTWLAANVSVGGRSRDQLVEIGIGQHFKWKGNNQNGQKGGPPKDLNQW
ncbi:hypothetical protein [Dehalococcoides mccartyi]|uniref:hypothetical protein n=1 Tax=Dehalococcoides mccartyi TaxID=61435 RepID=UPI0006BC2E8E|nr:hypothetical protein [Dehalococcoides mccartyi]BAS31169.1 hypothetical protein IBK_0094 [Dehalococcoides mccartyi IBARAKI]